MQAGVRAVNDVDVSPLVRVYVVGLNGGRAVDNAVDRRAPQISIGGDVGDVERHFFRSKRIADVDTPHPRVEVRDEHDLLVERVAEVLVGGVRAEATAALAEVERTA